MRPAFVFLLLLALKQSPCTADGFAPPSTARAASCVIAETVNTPPLSVGDTLSADLLSRLFTEGPLPELSQPGHKLLLLDFWAAWCSNCLVSIRKTDSLLTLFAPALQVLMINTRTTGDDARKVAAFYEAHRKRNGERYTLPTLVGDTLFDALFPHKSIPHYVWINEARQVVAITSAGEVTAANVRAVLNGEAVNLPLKNDFRSYSPAYPLFAPQNEIESPASFKTVTLTSAITTLAAGHRRYADSLVQRSVWLNQSVLSLYRTALGFTANRVVLEVNDPRRYAKPASGDNTTTPLYCVEITLPAAAPPEETKQALLQLLNTHFGLNGRMEVRDVPCWALRQRGAKGPAPSAGGSPFTQWYNEEHPVTTLLNQPLSKLVSALNSQVTGLPLLPIVLDETAWPANVDLALTAPLTDITAVKRQLMKYGLNLVPTHRRLNVFVLSTARPAGRAASARAVR